MDPLDADSTIGNAYLPDMWNEVVSGDVFRFSAKRHGSRESCRTVLRFLYALMVTDQSLPKKRTISLGADDDQTWHNIILDQALYEVILTFLKAKLPNRSVPVHSNKPIADRDEFIKRVHSQTALLLVLFGPSDDSDGDKPLLISDSSASSPKRQRNETDEERMNKKAPSIPSVGSRILISISSHAGVDTKLQKISRSQVFININYHVEVDTKKTKMREVFESVAENLGKKLYSLRFHLHGENLRGYEDETVAECGLEDGDQIDVMFEQCGC